MDGRAPRGEIVGRPECRRRESVVVVQVVLPEGACRGGRQDEERQDGKTGCKTSCCLVQGVAPSSWGSERIHRSRVAMRVDNEG